MPVKPIYQEITSDAVDLEDRTFALTPPGGEAFMPETKFAPATLALLQPPLLLKVPAGKMQVISGRSILSVLAPTAALGCLLLPAGTSRATILELSLAAILTHRPATALEQANCWQKAEEWLGSEEARRRFGPQLELTRRYPPLQLIRLLDLPENQAAALQTGRLELRAAFQLLDLDRNSSTLLFRIIDLLQLSSSNQKKLLEIVVELNRRSGQSITDLLDSREGREIIEAPGNNPSQQSAKLMRWLSGLRYPRLASAEKDYRDFVAGLDLPAGVTLEHAPSFERDILRLTIEFRNRQALEACRSALPELLKGYR
jgi:hypothetical protein